MSAAHARGPIVIDTDVFGADLVAGSRLAERYAAIIVGRAALISFQTVAALRFGALRRGWGEARMRRLDALIHRAVVIHSGAELVEVHAQLRTACEVAGHALAQRVHTADQWIAATAIRHDIPLVSNDGIFRGVPGLDLETVAAD